MKIVNELKKIRVSLAQNTQKLKFLYTLSIQISRSFDLLYSLNRKSSTCLQKLPEQKICSFFTSSVGRFSKSVHAITSPADLMQRYEASDKISASGNTRCHILNWLSFPLKASPALKFRPTSSCSCPRTNTPWAGMNYFRENNFFQFITILQIKHWIKNINKYKNNSINETIPVPFRD